VKQWVMANREYLRIVARVVLLLVVAFAFSALMTIAGVEPP